MMSSRQQAGAVLGALAAIWIVGVVWERRSARRLPRRRQNPWVTLRNRKRVLISDEGRIEKGLPDLYRGVHVRDVSRFSGELREIERGERAAEQTLKRGRRSRTFKHDEGVRALLDANPELVDFLEVECSHDCETFRRWVRRGRRGAKPRAKLGDGRFDAINERWDKRRGRKVASWLEAVDATPPPSRRWSEFPARVAVLEEATGLRLNLPERAEVLAHDADDVAAVRRTADDRIEALVDLARSSRLSSGTVLEEAPF